MRTLLKSLFVLFAATQLIACTKENTASLEVATTAIEGNFTVSLFKSSSDETAVFNGFSFEFSNGVIKATSGTETFTGTFTKDDDGSNEFKIHFDTAPLNKLNKGWLIQNITATKISLMDDNPSGNGRLEFTKHS
jgi:hypothetical protein